MSGAGNRFWITHFLSPTTPSSRVRDWSRVAQIICRTNHTLKEANEADGIAILLPSKNYDFKWLFYNADGSPAEMCGNAACCVIDYVFKKQLISFKDHSLIFETIAQPIRGEIKDGIARIFFKQNKSVQGPFEIIFNREKVSYMFIDSGVPHAVVEIKNKPKTVEEWKYKKEFANILRNNTSQHKNGMNVSFYYHQKPLLLSACSFERGVEDFTPACGTGALAVAQVYRQTHPHLSLILIQMPGGQLEVGFHSDKTISLMSPVKWIQEIESFI